MIKTVNFNVTNEKIYDLEEAVLTPELLSIINRENKETVLAFLRNSRIIHYEKGDSAKRFDNLTLNKFGIDTTELDGVGNGTTIRARKDYFKDKYFNIYSNYLILDFEYEFNIINNNLFDGGNVPNTNNPQDIFQFNIIKMTAIFPNENTSIKDPQYIFVNVINESIKVKFKRATQTSSNEYVRVVNDFELSSNNFIVKENNFSIGSNTALFDTSNSYNGLHVEGSSIDLNVQKDCKFAFGIRVATPSESDVKVERNRLNSSTYVENYEPKLEIFLMHSIGGNLTEPIVSEDVNPEFNNFLIGNKIIEQTAYIGRVTESDEIIDKKGFYLNIGMFHFSLLFEQKSESEAGYSENMINPKVYMLNPEKVDDLAIDFSFEDNHITTIKRNSELNFYDNIYTEDGEYLSRGIHLDADKTLKADGDVEIGKNLKVNNDLEVSGRAAIGGEADKVYTPETVYHAGRNADGHVFNLVNSPHNYTNTPVILMNENSEIQIDNASIHHPTFNIYSSSRTVGSSDISNTIYFQCYIARLESGRNFIILIEDNTHSGIIYYNTTFNRFEFDPSSGSTGIFDNSNNINTYNYFNVAIEFKQGIASTSTLIYIVISQGNNYTSLNTGFVPPPVPPIFVSNFQLYFYREILFSNVQRNFIREIYLERREVEPNGNNPYRTIEQLRMLSPASFYNINYVIANMGNLMLTSGNIESESGNLTLKDGNITLEDGVSNLQDINSHNKEIVKELDEELAVGYINKVTGSETLITREIVTDFTVLNNYPFNNDFNQEKVKIPNEGISFDNPSTERIIGYRIHNNLINGLRPSIVTQNYSLSGFHVDTAENPDNRQIQLVYGYPYTIKNSNNQGAPTQDIIGLNLAGKPILIDLFEFPIDKNIYFSEVLMRIKSGQINKAGVIYTIEPDFLTEFPFIEDKIFIHPVFSFDANLENSKLVISSGSFNQFPVRFATGIPNDPYFRTAININSVQKWIKRETNSGVEVNKLKLFFTNNTIPIIRIHTTPQNLHTVYSITDGTTISLEYEFTLKVVMSA